MSSFVYGVVTAKRAAAPAGQSQTSAPPAMSTYIDTLAALIPRPFQDQCKAQSLGCTEIFDTATQPAGRRPAATA